MSITLRFKKNEQIHGGEPKVIIGTGMSRAEALLNRITSEVKELMRLRPGNAAVKKLHEDVEALQKSGELK